MNTKDLLTEILSQENLKQAYLSVKRNKGTCGVDKMSTMDLKAYLEEHGETINELIRNRTYKPQPVLRVEIPKADGGVRNLGIPTVLDRYIQQAITQVLTPIFDEQFSESSYGFRPKRNAEMAITKVLETINDGYQWVVDIDLEKFFDKVHHDKLMRIVSETIHDGDVISLIRKFLVSGIVIDEQYKESIIGTPQGGNLSPLLSNIMLDKLDKELESRGLNFVRYADDCLIMVGSEKAANRVMGRVTKYIEEELKLKVNVTKSKVRKPTELKYLGFGFYYDVQNYDYKAKPHEKSVQRLKEGLRKLTSRSWGTSMDNRLLKIKQLIRGWCQYFKIGKMKWICKRIDSHTRYRLRMCIWKAWKKISARKKGLQRLGVSKQQAWEWANTRKSYARTAMSFIMTTTVTNEVLAKRGLISLTDLYEKIHI